MRRMFAKLSGFRILSAYVPDVLKTMPNEFDSHEFIAAFAYQNQWLYVHALHDAGEGAFRIINDAIVRWLGESGLVQQIGTTESENMFKLVRPAAVWKKV